MSEYLEKLKKLSESQYFYAEAPWLKAIEHIEQLEKELCEAMDFADDKIKFCLFLTERNNKLQDENAELREEKEFIISEFVNFLENELWRWQELEAEEYVLGLIRDRSKANE